MDTATASESPAAAATDEAEPSATPNSAATDDTSTSPAPEAAADENTVATPEVEADEGVAASPPAASTTTSSAVPAHVNTAASSHQWGLSTTTTVTSAVVLLVALLAGLAVLVARSRRTRLATPEYVEPVPSAPAPLPARAAGEENPWTRQLLEALDNVIALDKQDSAPSGAEHPRPGTDSPAHDSDEDPEATAAWSPPFKSSAPPGPLEAFFEPADASPPDDLAEEDSEDEQVSEHPATDDDDTRPGSTGDSTP